MLPRHEYNLTRDAPFRFISEKKYKEFICSRFVYGMDLGLGLSTYQLAEEVYLLLFAILRVREYLTQHIYNIDCVKVCKAFILFICVGGAVKVQHATLASTHK